MATISSITHTNTNHDSQFKFVQSKRRNSRRKSRGLPDVSSMETFENTKIYKLCRNLNLQTVLELYELFELTSSETNEELNLKQKSNRTGNGFIHELILGMTKSKCDSEMLKLGVILLYRMALGGCDVNLQNSVGNTALHIACFRPNGTIFAFHLLRLGTDPCLENKQGYRIFVDILSFQCYLVKGQTDAYCSIWQAVQKEDFELLSHFLKCWFRVNTRRKRKSMIDCAYDTSNYKVIEYLTRFLNTNELVTACYACDKDKVQQFAKMRHDKPNFSTKDSHTDIEKPLINVLHELKPYSNNIIEIFTNLGVEIDPDLSDKLNKTESEFESTQFHSCVTSATLESLSEAWNIIHEKKVSLSLSSDVTGDCYLHLVVETYCSMEDVQIKRSLIRLMYKLAIAGINVNHRNNKGETSLVTAFRLNADRPFMDYLIQLGTDTSYRSREGLCISVNAYATRGQLQLSDDIHRNQLPGLWPAVEDNDLGRVRYWLGNLCRINCKKAGRNVLEYARDCGYLEIAEVLKKALYLTEFVMAAMAADIEKMKHCLAMGNGNSKVNACFSRYFAGLTPDWKIENVPRPILVSVMEMCPAEVIFKFIQYGVNLQVQYEEEAPCAPMAFYAFRDDIDEEISIVVAQHADLAMRDELGSTLLHRAVQRRGNLSKKKALIEVLLERQANVAARDLEGKTARDYCEDVEFGGDLRQLIDDHVLAMVYTENQDSVEELILQGYDHITDIRWSNASRGGQKSAEELAKLRYNKELLELLEDMDEYQAEIRALHAAIVSNCTSLYTKFLGEKKIAWGTDTRHRNILHLAVLYKHHDLVTLICDQFPQLIHQTDVLQRSPVHYAVALRDGRKVLSLISASNSVNLQMNDANNLTALEYGEEVESPTPVKSKSRGRRVYNYTVRDLVEKEKIEVQKQMSELTEKVRKEIMKNGEWDFQEDSEKCENGVEREGTFMTKLADRSHTIV